jgi:hypothetical protein
VVRLIVLARTCRSKSWLFGIPSFEYVNRAISATSVTFYIMSAWSGFVICTIFADRFLHERVDMFWKNYGGIEGILRITKMLMILALAAASMAVSSSTLGSGIEPSNREAVVVYDLECYALRVILSP